MDDKTSDLLVKYFEVSTDAIKTIGDQHESIESSLKALSTEIEKTKGTVLLDASKNIGELSKLVVDKHTISVEKMTDLSKKVSETSVQIVNAIVDFKFKVVTSVSIVGLLLTAIIVYFEYKMKSGRP